MLRRSGGVKLGDPERGEKNRKIADAYAEPLRAIVAPLAGKSSREIAAVLNERKVPAPRGGLWQSQQVLRLMARLGF